MALIWPSPLCWPASGARSARLVLLLPWCCARDGAPRQKDWSRPMYESDTCAIWEMAIIHHHLQWVIIACASALLEKARSLLRCCGCVQADSSSAKTEAAGCVCTGGGSGRTRYRCKFDMEAGEAAVKLRRAVALSEKDMRLSACSSCVPSSPSTSHHPASFTYASHGSTP